ncbi:MAG TPA: 4Fe-4S double cluster binding domain-containing protein [Negativicutes bacterium]|nr:4Fe-4S double cluster binding domain-containing protein [Negativicutes bacterium]
MISEKLYQEIEALGFRMQTFKIEHLKEISEDFRILAEKGLLDAEFYRRYLAEFCYDHTGVLEGAKSVIVIAGPQGINHGVFEHEGRTVTAVIPPTYMYPVINDNIADILNKVLKEKGYSFARPALPLKLLAVRSGLGRYGRNNVCYVPGLGSFIRLSAYITDYEFEEDSWGEIKALESCSSCTACIDNCPTGAIDRDRFLIHAHNCITHFNECAAPIPEWINPQWHNSLVGCMKCQAACPHNAKLIDKVDEKICFDEVETGLILGGSTFDSLPEETRRKLVHIGMESYYDVLARNIRLLESAGTVSAD